MTAGQLTLGEELKERGMQRTLFRESTIWLASIGTAIRDLAASGLEFTVEDARVRAGDPLYQNSMGAAFSRAARDGLIVCVGISKSTRSSRHASVLRVWRGA